MAYKVGRERLRDSTYNWGIFEGTCICRKT